MRARERERVLTALRCFLCPCAVLLGASGTRFDSASDLILKKPTEAEGKKKRRS